MLSDSRQRIRPVASRDARNPKLTSRCYRFRSETALDSATTVKAQHHIKQDGSLVTIIETPCKDRIYDDLFLDEKFTESSEEV